MSGPARHRCLGLLAALALAAASSIALEPPLAGRVWYVDNTALEGGDGSLVAPFQTLARAERASDAGDTIYVFHGDGTDRGLDRGIALKPYQRLLGSGVTFAPDDEEPLPGNAAPLVTATGEPVVTLASHTEVAGLRLRGSAAPGLAARQVDAVRLRELTVEAEGSAGAATDAAVWLDAVRGLDVFGLEVFAPGGKGLVLDRCRDVSLHDLVVAAAPGEGGAALEARDPEGRWELVGVELAAGAATALRVDARGGVATLDLEGLALGASGRPGAPGGDTAAPSGVELATRGSARLTVALGAAAFERPGRRGVEALARDDSVLHLTLEGSGFVDATDTVEAVVAHAEGSASLDLVLLGNDLLASDAGVLATAGGDARLRLHLADNVLPAVPSGRGIALVLEGRAEASLTLDGNQIAGQRAEALFVRTGDDSRLVVDLRDNAIAESTVAGAEPLPSVLLEARGASRMCAALSNNRVGEGPGGGPALLVRQLDTSVLSLLRPGAAEPAPEVTADNRLGRVQLEGLGAGAAGAHSACPAPPPEAAPHQPP